MVIDPDKHNKKVLRGILRGHDPTNVMSLLFDQYSNQVNRIKLHCKARQQSGQYCGQCRDLIDAYEYAMKELYSLRDDMKRTETWIRNKWKKGTNQ